MKTDNIKEIQIDALGRLCIFPEKERFTMIYRLAKEVHWDNNKFFGSMTFRVGNVNFALL